MGRYCGKTLPPLLISTTNVLLIVFKTDTSHSGEGFIANYITRNESQICGRPFFSPVGQITSPGFPIGYPRSKDCVWTITAPHGQQIFVNVTKFDIEAHKKCLFDYLEIR